MAKQNSSGPSNDGLQSMILSGNSERGCLTKSEVESLHVVDMSTIVAGRLEVNNSKSPSQFHLDGKSKMLESMNLDNAILEENVTRGFENDELVVEHRLLTSNIALLNQKNIMRLSQNSLLDCNRKTTIDSNQHDSSSPRTMNYDFDSYMSESERRVIADIRTPKPYRSHRSYLNYIDSPLIIDNKTYTLSSNEITSTTKPRDGFAIEDESTPYFMSLRSMDSDRSPTYISRSELNSNIRKLNKQATEPTDKTQKSDFPMDSYTEQLIERECEKISKAHQICATYCDFAVDSNCSENLQARVFRHNKIMNGEKQRKRTGSVNPAPLEPSTSCLCPPSVHAEPQLSTPKSADRRSPRSPRSNSAGRRSYSVTALIKKFSQMLSENKETSHRPISKTRRFLLNTSNVTSQGTVIVRQPNTVFNRSPRKSPLSKQTPLPISKVKKQTGSSNPVKPAGHTRVPISPRKPRHCHNHSPAANVASIGVARRGLQRIVDNRNVVLPKIVVISPENVARRYSRVLNPSSNILISPVGMRLFPDKKSPNVRVRMPINGISVSSGAKTTMESRCTKPNGIPKQLQDLRSKYKNIMSPVGEYIRGNLNVARRECDGSSPKGL